MIQLPDHFFSEFWQKKPCLLRQATQWRPEITPDELAGIACEETSRARIICEDQSALEGERWRLVEGPFDPDYFTQLPESHWTLVVQDLNSWDEQVAELLKVPIIPQWRIQDVMATYAVDQGSVGPHYDHYDVFLVQGMGQRRWTLGHICDESTELLPHTDILLLKQMPTAAEYVLSPGDILYIPPGIAHWGIAEGECMTFSIGFRAPSAAESLEEISEQIIPLLNDHTRYRDSKALLDYHQQHQRQHEIASPAIQQFKQLIIESLSDDILAQWLGHRSTAQDRLPLLETLDKTSFDILWKQGQFNRHPELTLLWYQGLENTQLFCHGIDLTINTGLEKAAEAVYLETLCNSVCIDINDPLFKNVPSTRIIIKWLLELEALA